MNIPIYLNVNLVVTSYALIGVIEAELSDNPPYRIQLQRCHNGVQYFFGFFLKANNCETVPGDRRNEKERQQAYFYYSSFGRKREKINKKEKMDFSFYLSISLFFWLCYIQYSLFVVARSFVICCNMKFLDKIQLGIGFELFRIN